MRLKREQVRIREDFVRKLVEADPDLTVRKIQLAVITLLGRQMRPARILEIRKGVRRMIQELDAKPRSW